MGKSSLNRVARFGLFSTAKLNRFLSLGPPGGFRDDAMPHFLELECLKCGEFTVKDVSLYALEPGAEACTSRFGAKRVKTSCYPTCPNPAHLVRKCKNCGSLGSVEVEGIADAIARGQSTLLMEVTCIGYKPVAYNPCAGWMARTAVGDVVEVDYNDGVFTAYNKSTSLSAGVQFQLRETEV